MIVKVAATQMSISWDIENNIKKADKMIENCAKDGANVILLQELFLTPYFCQKEKYEYFELATEFENNKYLAHFSQIAKKYNVVLPISFFEKSGNCYFNSLAMIDADGTILGLYRKSHIPTGECYEEKFYFTPGDTGFKVFKTKFGRIGCGICWDQWFPETARILALKGAELLFFPTAIGTEPVLPKDSKDHWQNTMCGHAAANIMPVIASNRIGSEVEGDSSMTFFGSSFIANEEGTKVKEMDRVTEGFITYSFDLTEIEKKRYSWGVYRDRRVDLYTPILKTDDSK
ncbi:MAG: N-carbamoylputrescine amidase [Acholeplasmatales bacterium]|nr:N-carbamoylputrescine amidase [Acholeplasmatales bacterium]